jgi:Zn-dependent peptidase ImmA (M78 family)
MGTRWEMLVGDTSTFAIKLALSDDPDEGAGVTQEEAASWGSLQLWVNDTNLCLHQSDGELVGSVHWYLLPLIEWIVSSWDPIFHEERLPNKNSASTAEEALFRSQDPPLSLDEKAAEAWSKSWHAWWSRHNLEAGRAGGIVPSLCIRRWRDMVEISWDSRQVCESPSNVRFTQPNGVWRMPAEHVAGPLHAILKEVAERLSEEIPKSERLRNLLREIDALGARHAERFAWLLGFGSSLSEMSESYEALMQDLRGLGNEVREALFGSTNGRNLFLPSFPAALMFGAVSPDLQPGDRVMLIRSIADAYQKRTACRVDELSKEVPIDNVAPWDAGYELAMNLLDVLGVETDTPDALALEELIDRLGILCDAVTLEDTSIRGIAIGGKRYRPTILLNTSHQTYRYPSGVRFSKAHELCHLLYDRGYAQEVALPSGPWAPLDVERRANAFAAMLLMPPGRLSSALVEGNADAASLKGVQDICIRLKTSFSMTVEHMHNLGFLSEEERDALRAEADDQAARPHQ